MSATVLVLGATGNVGTALCYRLAASGVPVRAFYDPSTPQTPSLPNQVTQIPGTFDDEAALAQAMKGVDAVFMLTPPSESQVRWQRTIAGAARREAVRRIVKLSAFDSSSDSSLQMGRWHYDGESAVAESGCEYVIVRPQYFLQMQLNALKAAAHTGMLTGPASAGLRMAMVDVRDIAAVVAVACTRAGYNGEVLIPTGPSAFSFDEMAAELSEVVDREVRYTQRPTEEVRADFAARGWPDWHIEDYLKIHGEAASPLVTSCVHDVAGIEPTSLATFLRDASVLPQIQEDTP